MPINWGRFPLQVTPENALAQTGAKILALSTGSVGTGCDGSLAIYFLPQQRLRHNMHSILALPVAMSPLVEITALRSCDLSSYRY